MSSHICQGRLEYDETVALYKNKRLRNQSQGTNSLNKSMLISFYCTFMSRWPLCVVFLSALFNDKGSNKTTRVL